MKDTAQDVLDFWFVETAPVQWFQINPDFDALVRERFLNVYRYAKDGLFDSWTQDADGALALILIYDQFPRNMFRDTPDAYATDRQARAAAITALERGFDQIHPPLRRPFFYLPFEHSEQLDDQNRAVELFRKIEADNPLGLLYALQHRDVISRFGRFPHRNAILGRASTPDEEKYLMEIK